MIAQKKKNNQKQQQQMKNKLEIVTLKLTNEGHLYYF